MGVVSWLALLVVLAALGPRTDSLPLTAAATAAVKEMEKAVCGTRAWSWQHCADGQEERPATEREVDGLVRLQCGVAGSGRALAMLYQAVGSARAEYTSILVFL